MLPVKSFYSLSVSSYALRYELFFVQLVLINQYC